MEHYGIAGRLERQLVDNLHNIRHLFAYLLPYHYM